MAAEILFNISKHQKNIFKIGRIFKIQNAGQTFVTSFSSKEQFHLPHAARLGDCRVWKVSEELTCWTSIIYYNPANPSKTYQILLKTLNTQASTFSTCGSAVTTWRIPRGVEFLKWRSISSCPHPPFTPRPTLKLTLSNLFTSQVILPD